MVSASVPLSRFLKLWPAAALLLMGGLVWLILPGMVVTLDDDFWYLRSVIKTIQKGRPWTDDWLTPWAASCSSISALLFKLTGSFKFAIHFQLAAAAGLAAMGCGLFLKRQGTPAALAVAAPLLLLATPTVLFMFLMFTGVALYMACLWWCLLLADRRQWLWFLLPWGLAVASRQSAVAWLALPGWALLQEAWATRSWRPWTPAARRLLTLFAGAFLLMILLKRGMNPTEGQKLVLGSFGSVLFSAQSAIPFALGLLAWLAGFSVAGLLRLPSVFKNRSAPPTPRLRFVLVPVLAAAGAWGALQFRTWTTNTHDCYNDPVTGWILPALGAVLGAALALTAARPRLDASLAGLGSILLVALYGGRFDYYYNDALFFGLAAGFPCLTQSKTSSPAGSAPPPSAQVPVRPGKTGFSWPFASALALVVLTASTAAFWHARSAVRLATQQAHGAGTATLYEQALRSGKLQPNQVGMATFGYLGWLFQDYYAAHEGKTAPLLGGFSRYAQNWDAGRGTGILCTLPKSLHPWRDLIPTRNRAALRDTPGVPVLLEIKYPLFGQLLRYALLRGPSQEALPGTLILNPADFQRVPFPLNDSEWRHLIRDTAPLR